MAADDFRTAARIGDVGVVRLPMELGVPYEAAQISECWWNRHALQRTTHTVEMLQLLEQLGATWTFWDYYDMLYSCNQERCLESAQWARERGAFWPDRIYCSKEEQAAHYPHNVIDGPVWPANMRAWALSAGFKTIVNENSN